MTDDTDAPLAAAAIETLHLTMQASDSDSARIQAAKILLDRLAPKKDDEEQKHDADERCAALAEARGLLAEFAALKLAYFRLAREVAEAGAARPIDPARELEDLAHSGRARVGENADGR